jgi:hypothetical protein
MIYALGKMNDDSFSVEQTFQFAPDNQPQTLGSLSKLESLLDILRKL